MLETLTIVLPAHDEADNVEAVVREAVRQGRAVADRVEVIVVDDGSRDGTGDRARRLGAELPEVRVVRHAVNRGYGAALRTGFHAARSRWVFYTDCDGQFDLADLPAAVALLDRFDIVSGYRAARHDGPLRSLLGWSWTRLVDALLDVGVRDVDCAFKIYPRALFDRIVVRSDGALVDAEILSAARRLGYRVGQLPVRHLPRTAGRQSGVRPRVVARALVELARACRHQQTRLRPVRFAS